MGFIYRLHTTILWATYRIRAHANPVENKDGDGHTDKKERDGHFHIQYSIFFQLAPPVLYYSSHLPLGMNKTVFQLPVY